MRLFQTVDMRGGNPVSQIVRFSIPMLLGNIAQQLYNTVDSIIVGRFVGDNALAAVGSAGPILNLMIVLLSASQQVPASWYRNISVHSGRKILPKQSAAVSRLPVRHHS